MTRRASVGTLALILCLGACSGIDGDGTGTSGLSTETTVSAPTTLTGRPNEMTFGSDALQISGRWIVTDYRTEGEWQPVVVAQPNSSDPLKIDANALHEPWIDIGEHMTGSPGGCNDFYIEYRIEGDLITVVSGSTTAMACDPSDLEDFFSELLTPQQVVRVAVEDGSMTWITPDASARFARDD